MNGFYKYIIISCLFISTSNSFFGQNNRIYESSFILDFDENDAARLNFIEDSLNKIIEDGRHSEYYFNGYSGTGFDVPVSKTEAFELRKKCLTIDKLNSFFYDLNWEASFSSFALTGFNRVYYQKGNTTVIKVPLYSYTRFFQDDETQLIHNLIKQNLAKKIDSNFIMTNNDEFKTHRKIGLEIYEIFPQLSLNIISDIIKQYLMEGKIKAFKSDSLINELSKQELNYQYFTEEIKIPLYNNDGYLMYNDDGSQKMGVSYGVCDFTSLTISEQIKFNDITDTSIIKKYLNEYYLNFYNKSSPMLTVNFKYKAIGIDYLFDLEHPVKTIWLNYDEVKKIMINEKINFELYEAIFTKNLFEKLKVNNYYWQDSDYLKK
ncbi:MAG: hypothetical protein A3K10_00595 [Bacteroidetes bacterium RIFCSPLOWO2_12_FULL_31_6]|nr:MAG: hypothetical protein A3K10_00595 [Bacteroidetes bacterium RIFCSPLOWO2_12_FULL_31_6]